MKLFLDSYYFYSWIRLLMKGVKERVRDKGRVESILFFDNLQVRVLSLEVFQSKVTHILQHKIIKELYTRIVIKGRKIKKINLRDLLNKGVNDEQIPLIEYLLLADDNGKVSENDIKGGVEIKVDDRVRKRIISLAKFSYPSISPSKYREYLIARVERVLGIRIEREFSPTTLIKGIDELVNDIEKDLCNSAEARNRCEVVKESGTVRNHKDDAVLALAVATYAKTKNIPVMVVPKLPVNYECFHHTIKYIREKENLKEKLIIIE